MNAIVSGRSGRALIIEGETLKSIEIDEPSVFVPRKQSDLPYLFGDAGDLRIVENTTAESVFSLLTADVNFTLALDLTLISLDSELERDIRREALEGLEELFADSQTIERVEHVMYSHPVPDDGDLDGALEIRSSELELVSGFLQRLEERQTAIAEVNDAWKAIPTKNFDGYENRQVFRRAAVQEGLFHALTSIDSPASISNFLLRANLNKSIMRLPNFRQVIQAWVSPFRQSRKTPTPSREEEKDRFSEPEKFSGRSAKLDRRAVLREALRRKSVIVAAMRRRDLPRVYDLVDGLVAFHQAYSESQHTAKSLCDLAMEAKALEMSSLQLALTNRSINIAPGDSWSWIQHADALLKMQRLDEALRASDEAMAFGGGVVAKAGRAEILKAKGEFEAALALYDDAISEDPENSFVKTGRAGVLKSQGRFDAALAAYEEVIRNHPENAVAQSGRAEVLKAQGQFADALAAYEDIIRAHPYDKIAQNGRTCALVGLRRFQEALESLPHDPPTSFQDWIAFHIRGMILLRTGETGRAIRIFSEGTTNNPFASTKEYFRAALGLAWFRNREFKNAEEALEEITSPILRPRANVISIHVFGAQGERQRAIQAYESLATTPYLFKHQLTQELHHQYVLGQKPTKDDEWVFDREVQIFLDFDSLHLWSESRAA